MIAPTFVYNATVQKVVDGDTVDLIVDLGMRVSHSIRVRLYGINAPERFTPEGKAAIAWLKKKLASNGVTIKTFKDPGDKYGRWLALVQIDGVSTSNPAAQCPDCKGNGWWIKRAASAPPTEAKS